MSAWAGGVSVACVVFAAQATASAQDESHLRLEVGARWDVSDDVNLQLAQLLDFEDGMSVLGEVMPEAQVAVDVVRGLRLNTGYRFTANRRSEGGWRYEHRVFVGGRYQRDVGPLELSYRLLFQEDRFKKGGENPHDNTLRQRIGIDVEVHDVVIPYASWELYTTLGGDAGTGLSKWRATAGVEFDLDDHTVATFYRLSRPFDPPHNSNHTLGLEYRYRF